MSTRKFSGDMADQVDQDREELIRIKEVLQWASENVVWCKSHMDEPVGFWRVRPKGVWSPPSHASPTLYEALRTAWEKRDE